MRMWEGGGWGRSISIAACTVLVVCLASCISPRPSITIRSEPHVPLINELVWFEAVSDDGAILEWDWEFGDGAVATGQSVWHQYRSINHSDGVIDRWKVIVRAVDDRGRACSASVYIQVQPDTGELAGYCIQDVGSRCDGIGTRQPEIPPSAVIEFQSGTVTEGWWQVPSDRSSYLLVKLHFVPREIREVTCTWTLYSLGDTSSGCPMLVGTLQVDRLANFGPTDANWYNGYLGFPLELDPVSDSLVPGWYVAFAEVTATTPVRLDRNIYDFRLRVGNS